MNYQAILAIMPLFSIIFILMPILFGKQITKNIFEAWAIGFVFICLIIGIAFLILKLTDLASWGIINL